MTSSRKSNQPRVIMIISSLPPMPIGGAEIQGMKLCRNLVEKGVDIKIITWGKIWQKRHSTYNGLPFTRVKGLINILFDLLTFFGKRKKKVAIPTKIVYDDAREVTNQMTRKVWLGMRIRYHLFYLNCLLYLWIRRNKFDIIHVHMMEWPAIVAVKIGKKLRKKVVIKDSTMNGILNLLRYPNGEKKAKEIASYAYCVAMTNVIYSNYLRAGVAKNRIFRIPNGIEVVPLQGSRKRWTNTVIFVGNLTQQPAKGVDILLFAWKEVFKQVPNASLRIVGEGDIEAYKDFAKSLEIDDSVIFLGKRNDVKELLLDSDIFVLPSRREGMSNALMEAMLLGMPVVATNVSGNEDLIEHEKSGLLVPVANVNELSTGIVYMLNNQQKAIEMGREAYNSVTEKCDMGLVSERYVELYKRMLNDH